jgi:chromosomal replication initiator protein
VSLARGEQFGINVGGNQVSADHRSPWDFVKEQLQQKLSAESFENWISRTRFAGLDGKTMLATAPDQQTASFLVEEYGQQINALAAGLGLGIERVRFTAESSRPSPGIPSSMNSQLNGDSELESPITLNPNFTFESFVVGSCNQFAHAAAQSVAMNPSRSYNPLFIYGGWGWGRRISCTR